MQQRSIVLGLDVHKESIAVARCVRGEAGVESLGVIPHTSQAVTKLIRKVGNPETIAVCYEAGPCGYGLHRQLEGMGVACTVVAPSMVPKAPGDRVKTDRRDAEHLARMHRNGELSAVWVPDAAHEGVRDLVRTRDQARQDLHRSRQRLGKYLLKEGRRPPTGVNAWTRRHRTWLDGQHFTQPGQELVVAELLQAMDAATRRQARLDREIIVQMEQSPLAPLWWGLQSLRGVSTVTASVLVAELGDMSRFTHPRQLMAYCGLVPHEHSSGGRQHRGRITKTGNAAVRRVLVEMAWHYAKRPHVGPVVRRRQEAASERVRSIAWDAQVRGNQRFIRLQQRNKPRHQIVVAVARELLGSIWEIAQVVRAEQLAQA